MLGAGLGEPALLALDGSELGAQLRLLLSGNVSWHTALESFLSPLAAFTLDGLDTSVKPVSSFLRGLGVVGQVCQQVVPDNPGLLLTEPFTLPSQHNLLLDLFCWHVRQITAVLVGMPA